MVSEQVVALWYQGCSGTFFIIINLPCKVTLLNFILSLVNGQKRRELKPKGPPAEKLKQQKELSSNY